MSLSIIFTNIMLANAHTLPPELMEEFKFHYKAGWAGYPLVGTADRIASELESLSKLGLDGVVLSWVDYRYGLDTWRRDVMPRLEQAGLRLPARVPIPI